MVEVNVGDNPSIDELKKRTEAATILATFQATYTDFYYLRPEWRQVSEQDSLIGVSMTGIASTDYADYDLRKLAESVKETNKIWAKELGIQPAARTTTVKPSGTTSLVLGTSSGIHAWYAPYYKRRVRVNKGEAVYNYLQKTLPDLMEDDIRRPWDTAILTVPYKAPPDAKFRTEGAIEFFHRVIKYNKNWIEPGHTSGPDFNNVSCTINVQEHEWDDLKKLMWEYRYSYTGIALLPYDSGSYVQAPLEEISKEEFDELSKHLKNINMADVVEHEDDTNLVGELACSGGACEIRSL